MERKFIQVFAFIMAFILFISCPLSVYASEKWEGSLGLTLYYNLDEIKQYIKETKDFWVYAASQLGAFVKSDFTTFMNNSDKFDEMCSDEKIGLYKDDSGNVKGVYFSKEFMAELKALLEQYAKEHEPYYMAYTVPFNEIDLSDFKNHKNMYDTLKNLLEDSPSGVVAFGCNNRNGVMWFENVGTVFKECSLVNYSDKSRVCFYNNETWDIRLFHRFSITLATSDPAISSTKEFIEKTETKDNYGNSWSSTACRVFRLYLEPVNYSLSYSGMSDENMCLVSKERRRIRVFNTYGDFQNYTLGKRSVYYTSNYYNYVPEDLSVSIDDLQKEIDDLSKVIDQLLDQISKDTDESEIEELLRQILEALKNQQGGGGGTGGGDVNVDIDLSTTNGLLSKILAKVTQIFDKLSESVEGVSDSVHTKIQDTLDEMLVQIKKLKHWTMADTAVNAADAVADWLDFLKGIFDDMENGAGNAVAAISSGMDGATGLLKTKFPFCIPWDVAFLVTFLAHEPETPVFKLPIHLESIGIDEYIEVDMSDFSGISTISRTILMLIYCYGLLNLTMKIIPMAKEGS